MDWSSIYEEHGEETGDWSGWNFRLDPILESIASRGKYGPAVCYALTVNYILGVGCLGVPFAFLKSGAILGTLIIFVITLVTLSTVLWIAEASHTSTQIRNFESLEKEKRFSNDIRNKILIGGSKNYSSVLSDEEDSQSPKHFSQGIIRRNSHIIRNQHDPEVTELVLLFLGEYWSSIYQISLILLTSIGSLAYTQIFVSTFIFQLFPSCSVLLPILIFSSVVVPLSCMEISEQIFVQILMSGLRFLSLAILLVGIIIALFVDFADSQVASLITNNDDFRSPISPPYLNPNVPLFQYTGFGLMFTTAIFSQLFQHSVPGLVRPLALADRKSVPAIFLFALSTTGTIYILMGLSSIFYFGDDVQEAVNLNFVGFTWGLSRGTSSYYILVKYLSFVVVLFPAMDTLSIYPLIAHTVANSLHAYFPTSFKILQSIVRIPKHKAKSYMALIWKLVASVPPIFLSVYVTDLSISLQFTGICGIVVALVVPSLLHIYSREKLAQIKKTAKAEVVATADMLGNSNPYSTFLSHTALTYLVLILAFVAFFVCIYQLVLALISPK